MEREREEENDEVLSFFWMSQAQVRRSGKDEQEAGWRRGSGRKRKRERERVRGGRETVRKRERPRRRLSRERTRRPETGTKRK